MGDFEDIGVVSYNPHYTTSNVELRRAETKRKIDSLSQNYDVEWQIFQEPLQNAMDSHLLFTNVMYELDFETEEDGESRKESREHSIEEVKDSSEVEIIFNFQNNRITFNDKGFGIPVENFQSLFSPYLSTKSQLVGEARRQVKGHAGIGIKSTIYNANYVKIESIPDPSLIRSLEGSISVDSDSEDNWEKAFRDDCFAKISYECLDGWSVEKKAEEGKDTIFFEGMNEEKIYFEPKRACSLTEPGLSIEVGFANYGAKNIIENAVAAWKNDTDLIPTSNTANATINLKKGGAGETIKLKNLTQRIIELFLRTRTYAGCMTTTLEPAVRVPKTKIIVKYIGVHTATIGDSSVKFSASSNHEFDAGYHSPKERFGLTRDQGGPNCSTSKRTKAKNVAETDLIDVALTDTLQYIKTNSVLSFHGYIEYSLTRENIIDLFCLSEDSPERIFVEKSINGMKLIIARSDILSTHLWVRPGCFLSANGLITRSIIPETSFGGYDRAVHYVLDANVTVAPSKTDIIGYGPDVEVEGRGRATFYSDLKSFTSKIKNPIQKLAAIVATKEKKRKQNFTENDKKQEEDGEKRRILRKWFNCLSEPLTEQDVIAAFATYIAKKNYEIDWQRISQDTNYDSILSGAEWVSIAKKKTNQPDATFAFVEFKRNATDMIVQDDCDDDQNITYPVLVVSWDPVALPAELDHDYSFHTEDEDGEIDDALVYPDTDVFPRSALTRYGRTSDLRNMEGNNHWSFIFSLKDLFEHLIEEEANAAEENPQQG
jgi:hypothetical protein